MNIEPEEMFAEIGRLTMTVRAYEKIVGQYEQQVKLLQDRLDEYIKRDAGGGGVDVE